MSTKYYRFEFGSGSLAKNFKGSSSVQVHRVEILKVRVWFRFNDLKVKQFKFGSGSPKKSGFYRFVIQVRVRLPAQNISSGPRRMRRGIAMMLVLVHSSKILMIHGLKNYLKQTSSRQLRLQAQNERKQLFDYEDLASKNSFFLASIFVTEEFRLFF